MVLLGGASLIDSGPFYVRVLVSFGYHINSLCAVSTSQSVRIIRFPFLSCLNAAFLLGLEAYVFDRLSDPYN